MKVATYLLIVCGAIGFGIWWQVYKYHDCLRVGHTKTYCILSVGK